MFRRALFHLTRARSNVSLVRPAVVTRRCHYPAGTIHADSEEELICRYEEYFNRDEIDGWELRKGMNDLHALDMVPDPRIIIAGLRACRRINDYALAVRFLEAVKFKCGNELSKIYPYVLQEISPTLTELGIDTPESLGYDRPELYTFTTQELDGPIRPT